MYAIRSYYRVGELLDQRAYHHRLAAKAVATGEQEHVADQAFQMAQALHRPVGHFAALLFGELGLAQRSGIQHGGGQRRAQLVSKAGHHFAHGRQARIA